VFYCQSIVPVEDPNLITSHFLSCIAGWLSRTVGELSGEDLSRAKLSANKKARTHAEQQASDKGKSGALVPPRLDSQLAGEPDPEEGELSATLLGLLEE